MRTIFELGGTYPDAFQFLKQASAGRALKNSRLVFDALPLEFDGRESIHEEASARNRDIAPDADDPTAAPEEGARSDESS